MLQYKDDIDRVYAERGNISFDYRPTHYFDGPFINSAHADLFALPRDGAIIKHAIRGWLRPEDAAKLYELAYFADGPIFELGTAYGLSAAIMSGAMRDSGNTALLDSVDLNPEHSAIARQNLEAERVVNVRLHTLDASAWLDESASAQAKYAFAFVDHSHERDHVAAACERLSRVLRPDSLVAFHDFSDPRNHDDNDKDYGVIQGIADGLSDEFEFFGCAGCIGVYRYSRASAIQ